MSVWLSVLAVCFGLLTAFALEMLLEQTDSLWQQTLLSLLRLVSAVALLLPVLRGLGHRTALPARSWLWLTMGLAYPYSLTVALYRARLAWLPETVADFISSPTGFQMFMGLFLFASLPWTAYALRQSLPEPQRDSSALRKALNRTMTLLFALTAVSICYPVPSLTMAVLQWGLGLLAVALFTHAWVQHLQPEPSERWLE